MLLSYIAISIFVLHPNANLDLLMFWNSARRDNNRSTKCRIVYCPINIAWSLHIRNTTEDAATKYGTCTLTLSPKPLAYAVHLFDEHTEAMAPFRATKAFEYVIQGLLLVQARPG